MINNIQRIITLQIGHALKSRLRAAARNTGTNCSAIMREALIEYLNKMGAAK